MKKSTIWTIAAALGALGGYSAEAFKFGDEFRYLGFVIFGVCAFQAWGAKESEKYQDDE
jgi:hypothetical protein